MSDDVTSGVESERKYDVPDAAASPQLSRLGFDLRSDRFTLTAVYYDTADDTFFRNRMTLRRREGGHDAGWHLKTPGQTDRVEHQTALSDDLPDSLRAVAADALGDHPIVAIARLVTDRTTTTIVDGAGGEIAEVAEDRVMATDLRSGEQRQWREWEAELLPAAPADAGSRRDLLDRLERALIASGAVPSSSVSKLARATGRAPLPRD